MVLLTLVDGKKGPGDILVLVTSYNEPMSIADVLYLLECIMDSEAMYYPISKGYSGKAYFLNAVIELACGVPFERVIQKYGLKGKKRPNVKDERKQNSVLDDNRGVKANQSSFIHLFSESSIERGLNVK